MKLYGRSRAGIVSKTPATWKALNFTLPKYSTILFPEIKRDEESLRHTDRQI